MNDYVLVFNGEIYNHGELRRELIGRGHRFQTSCDTEVVLHAVSQPTPFEMAGFSR
jgi:asparagine synthase (glutamine-hydrolysing)